MSAAKKELRRHLDTTREVILSTVPTGDARTTALAMLNIVEWNVFYAFRAEPRARRKSK